MKKMSFPKAKSPTAPKKPKPFGGPPSGASKLGGKMPKPAKLGGGMGAGRPMGAPGFGGGY